MSIWMPENVPTVVVRAWARLTAMKAMLLRLQYLTWTTVSSDLGRWWCAHNGRHILFGPGLHHELDVRDCKGVVPLDRILPARVGRPKDGRVGRQHAAEFLGHLLDGQVAARDRMGLEVLGHGAAGHQRLEQGQAADPGIQKGTHDGCGVNRM